MARAIRDRSSERSDAFIASQLATQKQPRPGQPDRSKSGKDQLETEVRILESPSVLKPVFDFVKQKKQQKGIDTQDWRYANWLKGSLTIKLVKGTSVLELAYRDTDKDFVLPVIQKISEAYQEYRGAIANAALIRYPIPRPAD